MKGGSAEKHARQMAKQKEIITHLRRHPGWDSPGSHPEDIKLLQTHGAFVLVGTVHALKIKKAVLFDYMDYSTLEKRHHYCQREQALNRRTAPALYLDIVPIYEDERGNIALIPDATTCQAGIVEWVLKMRAFDRHGRFDLLAANGGLNNERLDELTDIVAEFHGSLDPIVDLDMPAQYRQTASRNFDQLDDFVPKLFTADKVEAFRSALSQQLDRHQQLIERRARAGYVRFAHGDLHLQNICLLDGRPTLFDGVEYCDDFAISDILYDLSFLLMDLKANVSSDAANRVLNRYFMQSAALTQPEKFESLALLPYFLGIRAGIRAHVYSSRYLEHGPGAKGANELKATARSYFDQAMGYLTPVPPRLIAIGGFSGSGKSTLSKALAPHTGPGVGALLIRSDVVRRKLMNWDEFAPMPAEAYTGKMSEQVYEKMRRIAKAALNAGQSVVLDAVFDRSIDREPLEAIARRADVDFNGLWLEATAGTMSKRIRGRANDASDATVSVLRAQLDRASVKEIRGCGWARLDADLSPGQVLQAANSLLAHKR